MNRSVATAVNRREVNDGDLPLMGESPRSQQAVHDEDGAWMPRLIGACVDKHMSHKAAAITMGLDKSQATRQLNADGHLSTKRVGLLPADVLLDVAAGIREHFGVSDPKAEKRAAAEELIRAAGKLAALAVSE